jgi:positive regulator of sigma E activity
MINDGFQSKMQMIRGRLFCGTTTTESNAAGEAIVVIYLPELKPGQRVRFDIEEETN